MSFIATDSDGEVLTVSQQLRNNTWAFGIESPEDGLRMMVELGEEKISLFQEWFEARHPSPATKTLIELEQRQRAVIITVLEQIFLNQDAMRYTEAQELTLRLIGNLKDEEEE